MDSMHEVYSDSSIVESSDSSGDSVIDRSPVSIILSVVEAPLVISSIVLRGKANNIRHIIAIKHKEMISTRFLVFFTCVDSFNLIFKGAH